MKPKPPVIFLDTSALITLVKEDRPNHETMVSFYNAWTQGENEVRVVVSSITVAEYEAKADFPIQLSSYFEVEAFGYEAATLAGRLRRAWDKAKDSTKPNGATRDQIKDDFKIVAHAISKGASVIVTEDIGSLANYVIFAKESGFSEMFAWTLNKGFDTQVAKGKHQDMLSNQM